MRISNKIGDVFEVGIDENTKKYFQYIANDLSQLNSDVIRAFKRIYPIGHPLDILEIINDEVEFYAHCVTKWGVKLGYWQKVGNSKDIGEIGSILFRNTNDYGQKKGEERVMVSENWYVWKVNDVSFLKVGKLEGVNRKAEIGMVINPESIVHRMKTGSYDFRFYPGY